MIAVGDVVELNAGWIDRPRWKPGGPVLKIRKTENGIYLLVMVKVSTNRCEKHWRTLEYVRRTR